MRGVLCYHVAAIIAHYFYLLPLAMFSGLRECCKDLKRDHLIKRKQHWMRDKHDHDMFGAIGMNLDII